MKINVAYITTTDAQLASLLGAELGMALPSTLAFDFPTVDAIVAFLTAAPEEVTSVLLILFCGAMMVVQLPRYAP